MQSGDNNLKLLETLRYLQREFSTDFLYDTAVLALMGQTLLAGRCSGRYSKLGNVFENGEDYFRRALCISIEKTRSDLRESGKMKCYEFDETVSCLVSLYQLTKQQHLQVIDMCLEYVSVLDKKIDPNAHGASGDFRLCCQVAAALILIGEDLIQFEEYEKACGCLVKAREFYAPNKLGDSRRDWEDAKNLIGKCEAALKKAKTPSQGHPSNTP